MMDPEEKEESRVCGSHVHTLGVNITTDQELQDRYRLWDESVMFQQSRGCG